MEGVFLVKVIEKLDAEESISKFKELLLDKNIHNILIRGFSNDAKVALAFSALKELSEYNNGTLVIGNATVTSERGFLEKGLRNSIPHINLQDIYLE